MADILIVGLNHAYQFDESLEPSPLETEQRKLFTSRVRNLTEEFRPTIIADESPDTTNRDLLATYPETSIRLMVDISLPKRGEHFLWIGRQYDGHAEVLCPDVDAVRERYWCLQIYVCCKTQAENPRVFMLCGANHLYGSPHRAVSFPQLLRKAGHSVSVVDFLREPWWEDSWINVWKDPSSPVPPRCCVRCCLANGRYKDGCPSRDDRLAMKIQNRKPIIL